nr:beta-mannosidase [Rhodococcus sp. HNM0569]
MVAVLVAAVVATAGCGADSGENTPRTVARAGVDGTMLILDGNPWWPTGLNAYQLASDWSVNAGCGAEVDLDAYFDGLPPGALTRFDAFRMLATNTRTGALDFGPLDAVFAAAERHRQMVVPVLAGFDGACENEVFKTRDWYVDGWQRGGDEGGISYEEWVGLAVNRWKTSASLAMWDLIGEPEPLAADRSCPDDAASVLRTFVDRIGARVRSIDSTHPVTVGLVGGGQCGTAGDEYGRLAGSAHIDVLQYHDYGADGIPLPGSGTDGLAARIAQARAAGKPLLVAEIGQYAGNEGGCATPATRAVDVGRKIDGQRAAGTAGALLWAYVPDPRSGECTYDIGDGDPVRHVLDSRATVG